MESFKEFEVVETNAKDTQVEVAVTPSSLMTDGEAAVYDRQIRFWGSAAQQRIMRSKVLLVGLSCINVEVAKNLVLSGMNVCLLDDTFVKESDFGYNYFLEEKSVQKKKTKADATQQALQDMNRLVTVEVLEGSFDRALHDEDSLLNLVSAGGYTAVCVAAEYYPLCSLLTVDSVLRSHNVGFFVSLCCGTIAFYFVDMNVHHVEESEIKTDDKSTECRVETPPIVSFPSLRLMLQSPETTFKDFGKRTRPLFYSMMALYEWEKLGSWKAVDCDGLGKSGSDAEDKDRHERVEQFVAFGADMLRKSGAPQEYDESTYRLREIMTFYRRPFNLSASPLGGILGQEVRKYVTKQHKPIGNCLVYDMSSSTATAKLSPLLPSYGETPTVKQRHSVPNSVG